MNIVKYSEKYVRSRHKAHTHMLTFEKPSFQKDRLVIKIVLISKWC